MAAAEQLKCAVITPVGPGHEGLYRQCRDSVTRAFAGGNGLFSDVFIIGVDDTEGLHGRSAARNMGVKTALESQADWIFFLDADDLLAPRAFQNATPYLFKYDAVFGQIHSFGPGRIRPEERAGQVKRIQTVLDLLVNDPYLTIQMGHFVRARAALYTPFDETMDVGEDFDYYLRLWSRYKCLKIEKPLFFNRQGLHSVGPRSATGLKWRLSVEERIIHYARKWGLDLAQVGVPEEALAI